MADGRVAAEPGWGAVSAGTVGDVAPARSRRASLVVVACLLALAIGTAAVPFVPFARSVALSLVFVGVGIAVAAMRLREGSFDWFEIFFPVTAVCFLYFGAGAVYLLVYPGELPTRSLLPYLEPALALCVLGYLAFAVGYVTVFRRPSPSPTRYFRLTGSLGIYIAGIVGGVGAAGWVLQVRLGATQRVVSAGISLFQQFTPLFFFAWALAWLEFWQRRARRLQAAVPVAVLGCATLAWMYTSVGGKFLAIMLVTTPALTYWYARRKLPMKTIVVILLLSVFVIFPVYNTFRIVSEEFGTAERLSKTLVLTRTWDRNDFVRNSVWAFARRIGVVTSVAAILRCSGRWVDYRYGETLFLAPISIFIPRILWPEKPNIAIGREFGERFGLLHPLDETTQIAATVIGDFYWNFHIPGVIGGMFLLGAGYRWLYRKYGEGSRGEPVRTAIYIMFIYELIKIEGNVAMLLGGTVKLLAVLAVLLWILRRAGAIEIAPSESGAVE